MSLLALSGTNSVSGGYDIDNSVKLERDNTEGFTFTNSGAGNRKTWTISYWFKRTELSGGYDIIAGANTGLEIGFDPNNRFQVYDGGYLFVTNRVFRDTSAFYHIVVQLDTTQSTASNRIKLYVNGVEETSLATDAPPSQNADLKWNNTGLIFYVGYFPSTNYYSNGYLADVYSIDGQALAPTEFGEFDDDTGIWIPKKYTGTYGTNGFKLEFKDSSALGTDTSGSSKSISLTNISASNQATDTPTNSFCTLNPLYNYAYGNTITEGATKIYGAANNWGGGKATFGLTQGKWYWEIKQLANGNTFMGLQTDGEDNISSGNAQSQNTSVVFYTDGTLQYSNGSETTTSAANSIVANSIVGFALDLDSSTQTIKVYLNGSLITAFGSSGTANLSTYNLANKTIFPFVALYDRTVNMNFGGYTVSSISSAASDANGYGTFEYAPPSGYYALCTKNLAEYG